MKTAGFTLRRDCDRLLVMLLFTDIVFVVLHFARFKINEFVELSNISLFQVDVDLGYAEVFQYIKFAWIALNLALFAWWAERWRATLLYVAWMCLFAYLLLDDSLQAHERGGKYLAQWLGFESRWGLRDVDYGELLITALVALPLVLSVIVLHRLTRPQHRLLSRLLFFILLLLVIFGVGVDMIQFIAPNDRLADVISAAEDTGEMVVVSIALWITFRAFRFEGDAAAAHNVRAPQRPV